MSSRVPLAKKSLGQHWLDDAGALEAMCVAAAVQPGDVVLEVGPGYGSLTELLLERGAEVVAVELDKTLAHGLRTRFINEKFNLHVTSILEFDLTTLPPDYKVCANIPYYLTGNLIRVLSETPNPPLLAALLVQKEVAERVAVSPGAMSTLSVTAQFYWEVAVGRVMPAELFTPPPKVDSQILILKRRDESLFAGVDTKQFFRLVKAGFGERRKKLRSSLAGGLHISKEEAERLLAAAGIDPNLRAQALSLSDWHQLYTQALQS